jgi:regulatory protein
MFLEAARVSDARRVALRILSMRPRSAADLTRKLRDRGHHPTAVTAVIGQLEEAGLVDDGAFARHYARVRGAKGRGPSRLIHDLLERGVARDVAERAVAEVSEAEGLGSTEQARKLAERRAALFRAEPAETRRRRVLAYLSRRGFRGDRVRAMVDDVVSRRSVS